MVGEDLLVAPGSAGITGGGQAGTEAETGILTRQRAAPVCTLTAGRTEARSARLPPETSAVGP